jgi:adenine-specific DNA-methyltransferase
MRKSQKLQGHKTLVERKSTGAHYTPEALSKFVAENLLKSWAGKDRNTFVKVLDPAVGDGQLIKSLLKLLSEKGYSNIQVSVFDTDIEAIKHCKESLQSDYPAVKFTFFHNDFVEDFLLKKRKRKYDLIISNPPYVRAQELGATISQGLAREFNLSGSLDLSHAFILAIGMSLNKSSKFAVIISNRLLSLKGAWALREYMIDHFSIDHLWDFGDSKLFQAAVLPLVFVAGLGRMKSTCPFTTIYEDQANTQSELNELDLFDGLDEDQVLTYQGKSLRVTQGELGFDQGEYSRWVQKTAIKDEWIKSVESQTFCRFGDINKISVGIKSTADKVFIKQDWLAMDEDERPEVLRPLITHYDAAQYLGLTHPESLVLYTHEYRDGIKRVIELDAYPKTKAYLEKHASVLKARKYLQESKTRRWYEIWVAQDPNKWKYPKIVFRDISAQPLFWLDQSGAVVNGDCYWLSSMGLKNLDLIYLALAVGNSPFIEKYYDAKFNNKLYSGRRRFITQYVKEFPLPDPESQVAQEIIVLVKEAYDSGLFDEALKDKINSLVNKAFGVED